jgi:hypothetical protein
MKDGQILISLSQNHIWMDTVTMCLGEQVIEGSEVSKKNMKLNDSLSGA